jgi:hypothetical protein
MSEHHLRAISLLDSQFEEPTIMLIADDFTSYKSYVFVLCRDRWARASYLHNMRCLIRISSVRDMDVRMFINSLDLEVRSYVLEAT